jgi:hypothetical protein
MGRESMESVESNRSDAQYLKLGKRLAVYIYTTFGILTIHSARA